MISVDYRGSITETLLKVSCSDSKGALPMARERQEGKIRACHRRGTLFLDEIGNLSLQSQSKLLNVLRTGRLYGSVQTGRYLWISGWSVHKLRSHEYGRRGAVPRRSALQDQYHNYWCPAFGTGLMISQSWQVISWKFIVKNITENR